MFEKLKIVVDLIASALSVYQSHKKIKDREAIGLGLLKSYFFFKDCADEGEALLKEVGPDPIETIRYMDEWEAKTSLEKWEDALRRQGVRLQFLHGYIMGQDFLAVIAPEVQEKLGQAIGTKEDRVVSLFTIGASLFFRSIFPTETKPDDVKILFGVDDAQIDTEAAAKEIRHLKHSLEEYRFIIGQLLEDEEIVRLSKQARRETLFDDNWQ